MVPYHQKEFSFFFTVLGRNKVILNLNGDEMKDEG
jgi:hypothetical protein